MAWCIRELTALAKDLDLVPSTHMAVHTCNSTSKDFGPVFWSLILVVYIMNAMLMRLWGKRKTPVLSLLLYFGVQNL